MRSQSGHGRGPAFPRNGNGGRIGDQDKAGFTRTVRPRIQFDRCIQHVMHTLNDNRAVNALNIQHPLHPQKLFRMTKADAAKPTFEAPPVQRLAGRQRCRFVPAGVSWIDALGEQEGS